MDVAEVAQWTDSLRLELKSNGVRLSRLSAEREACMLLTVVKGLRCAGLISTFASEGKSVAALSRLLAAQHSAASSLVLVHVASQQTFVVHRRTLELRLRQQGYSTVFYPVDQEAEAPGVETSMPTYLTAMLTAIKKAVHEHDTSSAMESAPSAPVILLNGAEDGTARSSVAGVALAGWLLEYSIVYYYRCAQCTSAHATSWTDSKCLSFTVQNRQDVCEPASTGNNLADVELIVFCVTLAAEQAKTIPIMQFTIPNRVLSDTVKAIGCSGDGALAITDHLRQTFIPRIATAHLMPCTDVQIHWEKIVMDRVAI